MATSGGYFMSRRYNGDCKEAIRMIEEKQVLFDLSEYASTKDLLLRNKIIEENIYLVKRAAYHYSKDTGIDQSELESFGYEGLIYAVEHFDFSKNKNFSSYAFPTIRGYIFRGLSEIFNFPGHLYINYMKAKEQVENNTGESTFDNYKQIDRIVDLMIENGAFAACYRETMVRLLLMKNSIEYDDRLYGSFDNGFLAVECSCILKVLQLALSYLSEKEQFLIKERYVNQLTLEECAKVMGLTRQRVSKIELNTLRRLRVLLQMFGNIEKSDINNIDICVKRK